jgi:ABC-type uncharacterized transport system permease subunit
MISSFAIANTNASAWLLGLTSGLALLAYGCAALLNERLVRALKTALVVGWLAQAAAIVVDMAGIGGAVTAARFGFALALSMTLWLVLAVYMVENQVIKSRKVPLPGVRRVLACLGLAVVALAWGFPAELRPQASTPWAPVHWALGLASYGLFGAAVLHAALLSRAERLMRTAAAPVEGMPLLQLERMTFRFVAAGFVTLSAALVLGTWFAAPWRWDHKTVFSLLGWLVFAGLLAGRRAFGWRGPVATRWVYAGAALLLLAYVGSRFVLEVLLHRGHV